MIPLPYVHVHVDRSATVHSVPVVALESTAPRQRAADYRPCRFHRRDALRPPPVPNAILIARG